MERYLPHLIRGAEQRTRDFLTAQVCDPASPLDGGIRGEIREAKPTVYALATAMACYLHPQSALYRQEALLRALFGIRDGGFHTPNHRWTIAAALMQGANLFREEEDFAESLRARAAQYLAEGIDGDEDGEYAERSSGNYNAVVNNSMLALWQETGDDAYLGYVRRNLQMMLTYIDPDGLVFTQNSTRQDLGRRDRPDRYFYQYLAVCSHEENAACTSLCSAATSIPSTWTRPRAAARSIASSSGCGMRRILARTWSVPRRAASAPTWL